MQRRIVSFRCVRKNNSLELEVVETQELFAGHQCDISDYQDAFRRKRTFSSFLYQSLASFNGLDPYKKAAHFLYESFREERESSHLVIEKGSPTHYEHIYLRLSLPSDCVMLLKLIGALDNTLHELDYNGPSNECIVSTHFCTNCPENKDPIAATKHAFAIKNKGRSEPRQLLSRYVAEWIVNEYKNNYDALREYNVAAMHLEDCLRHTDQSLTTPIRMKLYPEPDRSKAIKKLCGKDEIIEELLLPCMSYASGVSLLIASLRKTLNNHRDLPLPTLQAPITKLFKEFATAKIAVWNLMIDSLLGKETPYGGHYHNNYTEIMLLREATMQLNPCGIVTLNILDTSTYREHYKSEKNKNASKLETELRAACHYLDLRFDTNQDFHTRHLKFTAESSLHLMNLKVHITENYCKQLMRAASTMRFFPRGDESPTKKNLMRNVPLDIQAAIIAPAFDVQPGDLAILARNDRSPKK